MSDILKDDASDTKECYTCSAANPPEARYCRMCNSEYFKEPVPDIDTWDTSLLPPVSGRYKVITLKDRFFAGKFNPELLQNALNAYAAEGWRLVNTVTADIAGGLVGSRNEVIMILEQISWDESAPKLPFSITSGVLFLESAKTDYESLGQVEVNINRQNAQLTELKTRIALAALQRGANVVYEFQHSQRASRPAALLNPIKWDSEYLSGFGQLAFVPAADMERVFAQLKDL